MSDVDWTDFENDLIVADYFAMLTAEISGRDYNKSAHRRQLLGHLPTRNDGSIEFKHQNVSAVLVGLGQPWITGYKPKARFQNSLVDAVIRWLDKSPAWTQPTPDAQPFGRPSLKEEQTLWIGPAPTFSNQPPPVDAKFMASIARKYDVAERDSRNRVLGKAGEERILRHEKTVLTSAGRDDLSARVRWTSVEDGDGAGYDISSFEPNGDDRLIEVKTTNGWERTPFHVTRNELAVADANRDNWHLIRLWNFAREPKAFAIRPPLDAHVTLTPTSFLASIH